MPLSHPKRNDRLSICLCKRDEDIKLGKKPPSSYCSTSFKNNNVCCHALWAIT